MATRKRPETLGQKLKRELSRPDDPFSIAFLIDQAAQTADWYERLRALLNGERSAWAQVRVNRDQVLELRIDNAMREARQLTGQLRQLIAEIAKLRGAATTAPPGDDVLAGLGNRRK